MHCRADEYTAHRAVGPVETRVLDRFVNVWARRSGISRLGNPEEKRTSISA
jgi:hypothetical protein